MTRSVVLCPGPSLAAYRGDAECLTVAVNRAALAHCCDVWAALDASTVRAHGAQVLGSPTLLTSRQTVADIAGLWPAERVKLIEDWWTFIPRDGWTIYSFTVAVAYAAAHGATDIECYGVDWHGAEDFDGMTNGNRDAERWQREAEIYNMLCVHLSELGISVRRINGLE